MLYTVERRSVKFYHTQGNRQCPNYVSHFQPSSNDQVYWDSVLRYSEADIEAIRKKFAKAIQRSNARVDPIDAYNEVVNDVYEGPEKPKERELRQRLFLVCPGSR